MVLVMITSVNRMSLAVVLNWELMILHNLSQPAD